MDEDTGGTRGAVGRPRRPLGWFFTAAIALLFLSVFAGVLLVGLVEKRKQERYRVKEDLRAEGVVTNTVVAPAHSATNRR